MDEFSDANPTDGRQLAHIERVRRERMVTNRSTVDQLIRAAIRGRRVMQFDYHGDLRIAEPHDYGISGGRIRLLVYQLRGRSKKDYPAGGRSMWPASKTWWC